MTDEKQNILPDLPTGEELEAKRVAQQTDERMAELREYLLDATKDYPEPYYMLEYNGVPFSTIGGIQALSGQKKNGKTFVLAQLMAAILGTGIEKSRTPEYLQGLRVPERTLEHLGHFPKVLYVDTEMEELNSAKVLRRVHWLCGWPLDVPCERFHSLWLRGITDVKEGEKVIERAHAKRYRLIKNAIEVFKPDAVFIDGLRDIMADFNNLEESASIIGELMAFAEKNKCCIWNTLHMNPRPGNDDESKMRGHAGTELGNKGTDTLVSIKKKDPETNDVTFTVKQLDARGKDLDDWKFQVTEAAGALGVPRIISSAKVVTNEEQNRINEAREYFKSYHWTSIGATYTELENHLKRKGVKSNRKILDLFNTAKEAGIIVRNEKRKYHYREEIPNDNIEDLPFEKGKDKDVPF